MFAKIIAFFFPAPTTAKALKGFNKAIDQLQKVGDRETDTAVKDAAKADRLRASAAAASDRSAEAYRLAAKLSEVIS